MIKAELAPYDEASGSQLNVLLIPRPAVHSVFHGCFGVHIFKVSSDLGQCLCLWTRDCRVEYQPLTLPGDVLGFNVQAHETCQHSLAPQWCF